MKDEALEKAIDLIEDKITELKAEIRPLFKGNSGYEYVAKQIRYNNKLLATLKKVSASQPVADLHKPDIKFTAKPNMGFNKNMNEKELEQKCSEYARSKDIVAVKLEKNQHTGIPDRLFIGPGGKCIFVEFKNPNGRGRVSEEQMFWKDFLGETCYFIDNYDEFLKIIDNHY